jgi:hypothetical protein
VKRFYNAALAPEQSTLPKILRKLVQLRTSQINRCGHPDERHRAPKR